MRKALTLTTIAVIAAVPCSASAATLQVDDDRAQCRSAPYTSVQAAVNAASSGDTIRVCQGTYAEQILLPRDKSNLSLRSVATLGATLMQPATGLPAGDGNPSAILVVRGMNTLVRGFRIRGPLSYADPEEACQNHTHASGIAVPEGSATIDSNRITAISITCPSRGPAGSGVHIGDVDGTFTLDAPFATSPRVTVDRNVIQGRGGVLAEGSSRVVVQRNTITGPGRDRGFGFFLLESFDMTSSVTATVRSNDISAAAVGVGGFIGGQPLVVGNRLHGNGTAIQFAESFFGELRDNFIDNNGVGIELGTGSPVSRWLVRGNRIRNTETDGIRVNPGSDRNQLFDNSSLGSGGFDCLDQTNGEGTAGTGNTWSRNVGVTDSPDVCRAP